MKNYFAKKLEVVKGGLSNNKGFSLVELIIVIAIMAVLMGVLAPQFIKYVEQSREATDMQGVNSVLTAIKTSSVDSSVYDDITADGLEFDLTTPGSNALATALKDVGITGMSWKSSNGTDSNMKITAYMNTSTKTVEYFVSSDCEEAGWTAADLATSLGIYDKKQTATDG